MARTRTTTSSAAALALVLALAACACWGAAAQEEFKSVQIVSAYEAAGNSCFNIVAYKSGTLHNPVNQWWFAAEEGFSVYLFESGTFVRDGDGGFENWSYLGNCIRRDAQTIECSKRC